MAEDHLDKETSLSVELTETGVKASAKSRAIAAFDRLCGNVSELVNIRMERKIFTERALIDGERKMIDAAVQKAVAKIGLDDDFARRVLESGLKASARTQLNKDGVMLEALQDLAATPPSEAQADKGPPELDPVFMDRFEQYAGGASTEELRARWGRVLAAEIRAPGTFSPKVLRATDELDGDTARLFESLMPFRAGEVLVEKLIPKLEFTDRLRLIHSGLIADPGLTGHIRMFGSFTDQAGQSYATQFGPFIIGFAKGLSFENGVPESILKNHEGTPAFDVLILTDVGQALASILPSPDHARLTKKFVERMREALDPEQLRYWRQVAGGMTIRLTAI